MHMQIELFCQCSYIFFANARLKEGRENPHLPGRLHSGAVIAQVIDDRPVGDHVDPSLGRHSGKNCKKLGTAVKATISGVGPVLISLDFERLGHFVRHIHGPRHLAGVLDFGACDRGGTPGHGENLLGSERLAGDRKQGRTVDPSGQGDENGAVLTQQGNGALLFLDSACKTLHFVISRVGFR
jgi:hypothetical protein